MQKNIIKKEVPEKIDRAEVYRLIKDTEVICVDNMKLRIQDEDGTWPVVSNSTAGMQITFKRNASSATAERLFHF